MRAVLSFIVAVTVVGVVIVVVRLDRRAPERGSPSTKFTRETHAPLVAVQSTVAITPASTEELSSAVLTAMEGDARLLRDSRLESLSTSIARQLQARASPEPAAYLRLIDDEVAAGRVRWIDGRDEKAWDLWDYWTNANLGRVWPRSDARGLLSTFFEAHIGGDSAQIESLCIGPKGLRVVVFEASTPADIEIKPLEAIGVDRRYWFVGGAHAALRAAVPVRTPQELMRGGQRLLCAEVCAFVRTSRGDTYHWNSLWYWDKPSNGWVCGRMNRYGWYRYIMYF